MAKRTHTQIVFIHPVPVTDGQLARVPASGGVTIPTNLNFINVELVVNLPTADKRAVGKSLSLSVYVTPGDIFVSGFTWTSYGHPFTVTAPDGTVIVDPDPGLQIPLANLQGQQIYLTYQTAGLSTVGVTVNWLA